MTGTLSNPLASPLWSKQHSLSARPPATSRPLSRSPAVLPPPQASPWPACYFFAAVQRLGACFPHSHNFLPPQGGAVSGPARPRQASTAGCTCIGTTHAQICFAVPDHLTYLLLPPSAKLSRLGCTGLSC